MGFIKIWPGLDKNENSDYSMLTQLNFEVFKLLFPFPCFQNYLIFTTFYESKINYVSLTTK